MIRCGTISGYQTHVRQRTQKCEPCREAMRAYNRAWYVRQRAIPPPGETPPPPDVGPALLRLGAALATVTRERDALTERLAEITAERDALTERLATAAREYLIGEAAA